MIFKEIFNKLFIIILIFSLIGCQLPGNNHEEEPTEPELLGIVSQFDIEDIQILNIISTDASGTVTFTDTDIPKLENDVEIQIYDVNGTPLDGIDLNVASVNGTMLILISDPDNIYQDSILQVDSKDYTTDATGSIVSKVIILGTVIIVVKLVLLTVAAVEMGMELASFAQEMYNFHVDNFEDISLKTITYRTQIKDIGELIIDTLDVGFAALSLASAISTAGTTQLLPKKYMAKLICKEVAKVSTETFLLNFLLPWIAEAVKDNTVDKVTENTEVYFKIHLWGSMVPGYQGGIEIIPILSSDFNGPEPQNLLGIWGGNWVSNTYGSTGAGKLNIHSVVDNDTIEVWLYNISYDPTVFIKVNLDLEDSKLSGGRDNCPDWVGAETLNLDGSIAGDIISLNYTLFYENGSEHSNGVLTARKL